MEAGSSQTRLDLTQNPAEVRWALGRGITAWGRGGLLPCSCPVVFLDFCGCACPTPTPMMPRTPSLDDLAAFPGSVWGLEGNLLLPAHDLLPLELHCSSEGAGTGPGQVAPEAGNVHGELIYGILSRPRWSWA